MRYGLLGPVEITIGDRAIAIGGPRARALLAALVLDAGRVVPVDRLVATVWGEHAPDTAQTQVRNLASKVRRALRDAGAADDVLTQEGTGYVVNDAVGHRDIDALEDRARAAADLRERSALPAAIAELDAALALWRGPALDGLDSPVLAAAARRFDDRRLALLEERIDLELDHGRHAGVVGQLVELVAEHPWRERFVVQLMRALHAAGRPHDALEHYHAARRRLADELGADPGPELTALAEAILRNDGPAVESPAVSAPRKVPRELPAAVGAFTGRSAELAAISALLHPDADDPAMPITLIIGAGGMGKTTLAVHWGHQAASAFPDGQLYINLHGWSPGSPMSPLDALSHLLQSLGVPKDGVPDDEVDAAALYRSLLADRRCLVVLDNAHSADHVRPLLPGSPGCHVVVTSRDALAGLVAREGATVLPLGVLDTEDAEALLARLIGSARVEAEREPCRELVRLCAGLPLALRIAAANLVSNPRLTVSRYLAAIGDVEPLTALAAQGDRDTAVRRTFDYSYQAIPAPAQRLFRLLSLHPGADFTAELAAAVLGATPTEADALLQTLANAHVIEWHAPGRFTFHDLIRQYAAERCRRDESAQEIRLRTDRLYGWHLHTAAAAADILYPHVSRIPLPRRAEDLVLPGFACRTAALEWLDSELPNLLALTTTAAAGEPRQLAWMLADALRGYLNRRAAMVDWLAVVRAGLSAAEATGAWAGAASAHMSLGYARQCMARYPEAEHHQRRALELAERAGWPEGQGAAASLLGMTLQDSGQVADAAESYGRALAIHRRLRHKGGQATNLNNLGVLFQECGRLAEADEHFHAASVIYHEVGAVSAEAVCLTNMGYIQRLLGNLDLAAAHLTRGMAMHNTEGDRHGRCHAMVGLALTHCDAGRHAEAIACAEEALAEAQDEDESASVADALNVLGEARSALGEHRVALAHHRAALRAAEEAEYRYGQTESLITLAEAHRALGQHDEGIACAREALRTAQQFDHRILAARAGTALAGLLLDRDDVVKGDRPAAVEAATRALAVHRECGHRAGEAQTLAVLTSLEE